MFCFISIHYFILYRQGALRNKGSSKNYEFCVFKTLVHFSRNNSLTRKKTNMTTSTVQSLTLCDGEVKRSEPAKLSTQYQKKVHYSKLFKTVYAVAI